MKVTFIRVDKTCPLNRFAFVSDKNTRRYLYYLSRSTEPLYTIIRKFSRVNVCDIIIEYKFKCGFENDFRFNHSF